MLKKSERTVEKYVEAGKQMQKLNSLKGDLLIHMSEILSAKDTDRLIELFDKINIFCSIAEDNMFRDHPQLSNDYVNIFFTDDTFVPSTT